jgi:hypothetical protein
MSVGGGSGLAKRWRRLVKKEGLSSFGQNGQGDDWEKDEGSCGQASVAATLAGSGRENPWNTGWPTLCSHTLGFSSNQIPSCWESRTIKGSSGCAGYVEAGCCRSRRPFFFVFCEHGWCIAMVLVLAEQRGVTVLVDRKRKGLIDYSRNCHLIVDGNKKVSSQDGDVAINDGRGRASCCR